MLTFKQKQADNKTIELNLQGPGYLHSDTRFGSIIYVVLLLSKGNEFINVKHNKHHFESFSDCDWVAREGMESSAIDCICLPQAEAG